MPLVSAIYASILTIFIIGLGYWVTRVRGSERVSLGTGESQPLERAVRVHGNLVENAPLALLILLFAELQGADRLWLHGLGAALVLARVMHAYGLWRIHGRSFGRFWGTALTWTMMTTAAVLNLVLAVR